MWNHANHLILVSQAFAFIFYFLLYYLIFLEISLALRSGWYICFSFKVFVFLINFILFLCFTAFTNYFTIITSLECTDTRVNLHQRPKLKKRKHKKLPQKQRRRQQFLQQVTGAILVGFQCTMKRHQKLLRKLQIYCPAFDFIFCTFFSIWNVQIIGFTDEIAH